MHRRLKYRFTEADKKFLRDLKITEESPGTIVKDFNALLDFIGKDGISVTPSLNVLHTKELPKINALLSKPIEIGIQRPKQKAYPYINGLYLLLRCSGFSNIETHGSKPKLFLDKDALKSWKTLNSTEQYFYLFEIFMLKTDGRIIGEKMSVRNHDTDVLLSLYKKIPNSTLTVSEQQKKQSYIFYFLPHYILALFELFGLAALKQGKPAKGRGWQIDEIHKTDYGKTMVKFFKNSDELEEVFITQDVSPFELPPNPLQSIFQPYFPEWKNTPALTKVKFTTGYFVFKVMLEDTWRKIGIPSTETFTTLALAILNAYDFDYDHLFSFTYPNRFMQIVEINHPQCKDGFSSDDVKLGNVFYKPGRILLFEYDFGESWQFVIRLEEIQDLNDENSEIVLLESHGESPPQYGAEDDEDWE